MQRNRLQRIGTLAAALTTLSTVTLSAQVKRSLFGILATLIICLGAADSARAQVSTADIVGTVVDASGAALPGATVTVTDNSTSEVRTQTSGASGEFAVTTLKIGSYAVKVQHPGFKTYSTTVALSVGDRLRVTATLDVGAIDQTIEVSTAAGTLQTETSSTGTLIPNTSVETFPSMGAISSHWCNLRPEQRTALLAFRVVPLPMIAG